MVQGLGGFLDLGLRTEEGGVEGLWDGGLFWSLGLPGVSGFWV